MSDIQRILIVRTDRLGDVILTLPMLPYLRERYPSAHIAMLLSTYTGKIVSGNPFVDELIWYDDAGVDIPIGVMRRTLSAGKFDAVIVVHPTLRLAWLMASAGIPIRIGTGYRYYSWLFNKRVYVHRKDARKHELEYNLDLLWKLDCAIPGGPITPDFGIDIPQEAAARVQSLLGAAAPGGASRLVVIHPSSGGSAREWPLRHFEQLIAMLGRDRTLTLCITGDSRDADRAERLVRASEGRAFSLAGKVNLKELAALVRRARLVIGNSTGPLHLAAALGTPVIGLYPQLTAMSPRRWGPYTPSKRIFVPQKPVTCTECRNNRTIECACMASIGVDDVYAGCLSLLGERTSTPNNEVVHAS